MTTKNKKKINGIIQYYRLMCSEKSITEIARDVCVSPQELVSIIQTHQQVVVDRRIELTEEQSERCFINNWAMALPTADKAFARRVLNEAWQWGRDSMPPREPKMFNNRKLI